MDNDKCILLVVATIVGNQDQKQYISGWVLNHVPKGRVQNQQQVKSTFCLLVQINHIVLVINKINRVMLLDQCDC